MSRRQSRDAGRRGVADPDHGQRPEADHERRYEREEGPHGGSGCGTSAARRTPTDDRDSRRVAGSGILGTARAFGLSRASKELNERPIGTRYASESQIGSQSIDDVDVVARPLLSLHVPPRPASTGAGGLAGRGVGGRCVRQRRPRATMAYAAVVFACSPSAAMARGRPLGTTSSAQLGRFDGVATVVDDPQPYGSSMRAVVELDGERFETWGFGRGEHAAARPVASGASASRSAARAGARPAIEPAGSAWQHVVGRFDLDWVADSDEGTALAEDVNRVRRRIETAADQLPAPDGRAAYRGLVIGDDRDQPVEMVERFRRERALPSHCRVRPERRLRARRGRPVAAQLSPWARWAATCALIGWFAVPDAVRAVDSPRRRDGRDLDATAFVRGRPQRSMRDAVRSPSSRSCSSTRCSCGRSGSGCRWVRRPGS